MNYIYIKTNDELYHHGIKGQKWGERNGPPYPLKPSAHSAAEKRANVKYGLDRLTNKNNELSVYAIEPGKECQNLSFNKKASVTSIREDMEAVNPDYNNPDRSWNCTNCCLTYTLRRMGYDVEALPRDTGRNLYEVNEIFTDLISPKNEKLISSKFSLRSTQSKVDKAVKSLCGDGPGVGMITIKRYGSGHVFSWEKTKDGKIYYIDSQCHRADVGSKYFRYVDRGYLDPYVGVYRLDTCGVDEKKLNTVCKNR